MTLSAIDIVPGSVPPSVRLCEGLPVPEILASAAEQPDARIFLKDETGTVISHAALWWSDVPPFPEQRLGVIGGFAARDSVSARRLLDAASLHLQEQGASLIVGPMNGNTWRSYRFVEESNGRPPFLLEPRNPMGYPEWWREAGFSPLASYSSSVMALDGVETVPRPLKERISRSGILIRSLRPEKFEEELAAIHALSLRSFISNFLYTPLEKAAFIASYRKLEAYVDPDFVRIAERDGVPCGFVFGIPDLEALSRGEKPALIVKTLAVDPGSRSAGLGSLLVDEIHRAAHAKGYTESIHALQHQTNTSLKITGRHEGCAFRKYVLFSKTP